MGFEHPRPPDCELGALYEISRPLCLADRRKLHGHATVGRRRRTTPHRLRRQAPGHQAKAHGNRAQQAGLEKALDEVTTHCTDAGLKKERENKVLDAKHEVSRRQADLDKAMKKGDPDKINKRKEKLADSRKELQDAVEELDQ